MSRAPTLNFTSALYLGMRHPHRTLRAWTRLTTGVPAAIRVPARTTRVAQALARLQGCEHGLLGPSTLHLLWDVFGMLQGDKVVIYMDDGLYPIARWGVERAAARGVEVRRVPHHDSDALQARLTRDANRQRRPFVVTDGWCLRCGAPAPLANYLAHTRRYGGRLLLDDTQAFGVLGDPRSVDPYGSGGGGLLRWLEVGGPDVIAISSLAKGFGVPVAVVAGGRATTRCIAARGDTRRHCSPPSAAVVHAADDALTLNRHSIPRLRRLLAGLVAHFRRRLSEYGFAAKGGLFPVQPLQPVRAVDAATIHDRLLRHGVRTVLHRGDQGHPPGLSFAITTRHTAHDLDDAVEVLTRVM